MTRVDGRLERLRLGSGRRLAASPWPSVLVAAVAAGLALALRWRGADFAAQVFRADLYRHYGFVLWNDLWFGGQPTLGYSVLFPPLGAFFGPAVLGALCAVATAVCADRLLRGHFGRDATIGSLWFAASTVTNLAVGRITFMLGVTFALAALLALQRRHGWAATGLGMLSALSSPVAAVFLLIALVAWAGRERTRWRVAGTALIATALPLIAVALAYPSAGAFPFERWALIWNLVVCAVVRFALPAKERVLRRGAVLYAVISVAVYAVPNALGGNVTRLGQYAAGPILACVLLPARRHRLVVAAFPLLFWQWFPAAQALAVASADPSTHSEFYTPLLDVLRQQAGQPFRVEIPITKNRWEAAYVAVTQPLARGWETQFDLSLNQIFYNGTLNASTYQEWLADRGVSYVALPAATLDDFSLAEARLLRAGLPYLTPVWQSPDWQLWRVVGSPGLVSGPAKLEQLAADSFTLDVYAPGDVLVRIRASSHWSVPAPGCATSTPTGWIRLRNLPVGSIRISQRLVGTPCPDTS